jgi:hypothetical protein
MHRMDTTKAYTARRYTLLLSDLKGNHKNAIPFQDINATPPEISDDHRKP